MFLHVRLMVQQKKWKKTQNKSPDTLECTATRHQRGNFIHVFTPTDPNISLFTCMYKMVEGASFPSSGRGDVTATQRNSQHPHGERRTRPGADQRSAWTLASFKQTCERLCQKLLGLRRFRAEVPAAPLVLDEHGGLLLLLLQRCIRLTRQRL